VPKNDIRKCTDCGISAVKTCANPQTDPRIFTVFFVKQKLQFAFREQLRAHTVDGFILLIHQPILHAYTEFYTLTPLLRFVFNEQPSRV
jgi:hypothetical protein